LLKLGFAHCERNWDRLSQSLEKVGCSAGGGGGGGGELLTSKL
jgi:hypothetical protein